MMVVASPAHKSNEEVALDEIHKKFGDDLHVGVVVVVQRVVDAQRVHQSAGRCNHIDDLRGENGTLFSP